MRQKYNLQDRVELLGAIPHNAVRNTLVRGHVFLNTSLTEAFCIAICEAAAAGLFVVSTDVGGIPEVLPPDMRFLAPPEPEKLLIQLEKAVQNAKSIPYKEFHARVKGLYNWRTVAERTERVYESVIGREEETLRSKVKKGVSAGPFSGFFALLLFVAFSLFVMLLDWLMPASSIDIAPDFPYFEYRENKEKFGSHTFKVDNREGVKAEKLDGALFKFGN